MNIKNIQIHEDFWLYGGDGLLEYVTVITDGVPEWKKVTHDEHGAFILLDESDRHYVLVI